MTEKLSCRVLLLVAVVSFFAVAAWSQTNYDESKVPRYTLPDALVCADGTKVDSAKVWTGKRRPEILALFEKYVYGKAPGRPVAVKYEIEQDDEALDDLGGGLLRAGQICERDRRGEEEGQWRRDPGGGQDLRRGLRV